ncbi:MAG TPA: zinc-binding dehydrogenase [Gemmatimonadota bacterium]|nr:zinc-binding dehydrogenase [Gemmatimonadota bacterium]
MKALRLEATGRPLREADVPLPEPGPGEVRVRVRAAGICHSDVHYRAGTSPVGPLPLTPGHEVAGEVEAVGPGGDASPGDRVALHYLVGCGTCDACREGRDPWCAEAAMLGKDRDGGYAEAVVVPARNAVPLPGGVGFAEGAVVMCSTSTAYHALVRARAAEGESVAVFGCGGLGASAIQLAALLGAGRVFGVDVAPARLELAGSLGAEAVDAGDGEPSAALLDATGGRGVDVALELAGSAAATRQAVLSLAPGGRVALAGIHADPVRVWPYRELIGREREILGVSDHRLAELPRLLAWVAEGRLDLGPVIERRVPLAAGPVNGVLDELEAGRAAVRTVIEPG